MRTTYLRGARPQLNSLSLLYSALQINAFYSALMTSIIGEFIGWDPLPPLPDWNGLQLTVPGTKLWNVLPATWYTNECTDRTLSVSCGLSTGLFMQ